MPDTIIGASDARKSFFQLVQATIERNQVTTITSKRGAVVMISQHDWDGIQTLLELLQVRPNIRAEIDDIERSPESDWAEMSEADWDIYVQSGAVPE